MKPGGGVRRALLGVALSLGEPSQRVLDRYAAEGFLRRLGASPYRRAFVLKGAMLLAAWGKDAYRATNDADFHASGDPDPLAVAERVREICDLSVEDGVVFDTKAIRTEPIREQTEYSGVRLKVPARIDGSAATLRLDIGFGDRIFPRPATVAYPSLVGGAPIRVAGSTRETVVAEKLQAAVVFGATNTRFKDFYDVSVLAAVFSFDVERLAGAVRATFERRRTRFEVPDAGVFVPAWYEDARRSAEWRRYLARSGLDRAPAEFADVGALVTRFIGPPVRALAAEKSFKRSWPPGGPWR